MASNLKRRWRLSRVRAGDGSALAEYRWWHLFSRSVFYLELADPPDVGHVYAVEVRPNAEARSRKEHEAGTGRSPAALYRDGVQVSRSNLPATFPVPGGHVEVAASAVGVKRMHYVTDTGTLPLRPDPRSQEGRRARFARRRPRASALLGAASLLVLLGVLVVTGLQLADTLSRIPAVAENLGTFASPVDLSAWGNVAVGLVGGLASLERATRLRYHWLVDGAAA